MPLSNALSRRDWLKLAGVSAAAAAVGSPLVVAQDAAAPVVPQAPADRKRSIRLAHMTDTHIQPERKADQGVVACLHHLQSQKDRPELLLTGGDTVFDCFDQSRPRTQQLWDMWKRIIKAECSTPMQSCLGNHDVWGWNKTKSKCTGDEAEYGKKWACDVFEIPRSYRSFDKAGWHFIVLDSVFPNGDGYLGRLDDEQFAWLEGDLKAVDGKLPVLILSHIPIISVAAQVNAKYDEEKKEWRMGGSLTHTDAKKLRKLFNAHSNVKLCLSGHLHLQERLEFEGVTYICNGAVSGNWWKGRHQSCDEGYAIVDLYNDGTFENQYVRYGWKADV